MSDDLTTLPLWMPVLETERLQVRPFALDDLGAVHRVLDGTLEKGMSHTERTRWLQWTVLNTEQLARLYQPPYGDRAIVLRENGQLIGACGLVPYVASFAPIPGFPALSGDQVPLARAEMGLYYAVDPAHRRQGYATEAASALVRYAFDRLRLHHIIATTDYDNLSSIGVMQRLGMRVARNPTPDPPWMQIVSVLANDGLNP